MKAILISDGGPETRHKVRRYLESRGYDVVAAKNGHDRGAPLEMRSDLALLDLDSSANGANPYLPIIAVTGYARHTESPSTNSPEIVDFRALSQKVTALLRARSQNIQPQL